MRRVATTLPRSSPDAVQACFLFRPAATEAEKDGVPVFKFPRWRVKGQAIPEVVDQYARTGAELNVLPFCSQFIPMEVIDQPKHGSIIYHPSLLPRHRGASAINWSVSTFESKNQAARGAWA